MSSLYPDPPPRRVTLELVTPNGTPIGRLPEVPVDEPWWPDVEAIVAAARERFGIEVVVLRMLDTELPRPHGGGVTYLAEISSPIATSSLAAEGLLPFDAMLDDQPLRLRYAKPGGPGLDLDWAETVLRERRIERDGPPVQIRTWNLSSIWRLPLAGGASAWLKVVPPFFAHEGDMLRRLQGDAVPRLLGHDGDRVLLADIEGDDLFEAPEPVLFEMVPMLVRLQAAWIGRADDLLRIGLPDWRGPGLSALIEDVVQRRSAELPSVDADALAAFVAGLPERFAAIAACGLPDTLVHGDYHPGNVRGVAGTGGEPSRLTMLDWGDCGIGNPLLDLPAFLRGSPPASHDAVRALWLDAWRDLLPGCDAGRAASLIGPIAAARQAVIYQKFLDNIEPVERRHHDADVPGWLGRTAAIVRPIPHKGPAPWCHRPGVSES